MMSLRLHTKPFEKFLTVFLGACILAIFPTLQLARAGPENSFDRQTQCQWVRASGQTNWSLTTKTLSPEPLEEYLVNEDVNIITGLYTRSYSRQQDGVIDYKTARQILISEYNEHWNSVVETKEFPLLYWEDDDQDGEFDMWIDRQGDGSPCDIVPYQIYENASGAMPMGLH
ncbi:MAG: hypothetical protein MRJ96_06725 [Nitrospirales bacterium]|nr:hypothetical protein [Nitrospira sp.]MDR4501128.1 hypothetical protein [Nitrospirales bacterium]